MTINNGTAPYKFQAIVGDVRAHDWFVRLHTQVHSSEHQKQPTGHQVKWFVARLSCSTETNPSPLDICGRLKRQREVFSYVTHITDKPRLSPSVVMMTDAKGNAAVSGVYTVGAGRTNSCTTAASTLTVGMENMSTYSVSLKFGVGCSEHLVICRRP